jgi:transposase
MPRLILSDAFWSKLEKILLQEAIYNKRNLHMTVEGMLYRMRVGCLWRDLPKAFGCWNSIYKRFNAWSSSNKRGRIFKALTIDPGWEWKFIDGSYVKVHQHSSGAVGQEAAGHREKPCGECHQDPFSR